MVEGKTSKYLVTGISYIYFIIFSLACIIPFVILISASLSNETMLIDTGYGILPKGFTLDAYKIAFSNSDSLINAYLVTIFTTTVGSVLATLIMSMVAYPLARKTYKPRNAVSFYIYFTMLFSAGAIPNYILYTQYLGLKNNILVLILPMLFSPYHTFVLRTYFSQIPDGVIEAAKIDGASEWQIFMKIVMPMSITGVVTILFLQVLHFWNQWYACLMYITDDRLITLQYYLQRVMSNVEQMLKNQEAGISTSFGTIPSETTRMAICIIAAGPMIFVFSFFQKYFTKGMTVGSVKG